MKRNTQLQFATTRNALMRILEAVKERCCCTCNRSDWVIQSDIPWWARQITIDVGTGIAGKDGKLAGDLTLAHWKLKACLSLSYSCSRWVGTVTTVLLLRNVAVLWNVSNIRYDKVVFDRSFEGYGKEMNITNEILTRKRFEQKQAELVWDKELFF